MDAVYVKPTYILKIQNSDEAAFHSTFQPTWMIYDKLSEDHN